MDGDDRGWLEDKRVLLIVELVRVKFWVMMTAFGIFLLVEVCDRDPQTTG